MPIGIIMGRNNGVDIPTIIGTDITVSRALNQVLKLFAMILSNTSTSLPNLFRTRPAGVVSKKAMGDDKILRRSNP